MVGEAQGGQNSPCDETGAVGGIRGLVSLVGAGLGGAEHLTVKAVRRLQAADIVYYDALVGTDVVALAARAQHFYVGKRTGRKSISQATI